MSDIEENKFDRQIRSILENAEEEVPGRVWEALSERLDNIEAAKKRRAAVLPWLRYAGITAAAAAVAVGVFLGISYQDSPAPGQGSDGPAPVAQVMPSEEDSTSTTVKKTESTEIQGIDIAPESKERRSRAEAVKTEAGESAETESAINQEAGPAETEPDSKTEVKTGSDNTTETIQEQIKKSAGNKYVADNWADPFARESESKSKVRTALVLSGVASSNTGSSNAGGSGTSRPMMSVLHPTKSGEDPIAENSNSNTFGIPLSFGVGAKIIFTPRWSLGVGINYTMLSRTFTGTYTKFDADGHPTAIPNTKIKNTQAYIGIPVNAYFSVVKSRAVDFYAYAGGAVEKCLSDRYRMAETGDVHREKVAGFQFSANAGIGVEFIIADMLGLYIDPSIRYYFPDSRQPKSIRTVQPLALGFEMGFRIRL